MVIIRPIPRPKALKFTTAMKKSLKMAKIEVKTLEILKKWRKTSKARRKPLKTLAKSLEMSENRLKSRLNDLPKRVRLAAQKLDAIKRCYSTKYVSAAAVKRSLTPAKAQVSVRFCQRARTPTKKAFDTAKKKAKKRYYRI